MGPLKAYSAILTLALRERILVCRDVEKLLELRKEVNQLLVTGTAYERQKSIDTASTLLRLIDVQLLRANQRVFAFSGEPMAPRKARSASQTTTVQPGEQEGPNSALAGAQMPLEKVPITADTHANNLPIDSLKHRDTIKPSDKDTMTASSPSATVHIKRWLKTEIMAPNVVLSRPHDAVLHLKNSKNVHISGASGCVVSVSCSGPIMVQNATKCVFSGSCHQLRVHGCLDCVFAVTTAGNRVVIEASSGLAIGPFEPGAPPPEVDDFSWPSGVANPHYKTPPHLSGAAIGADVSATAEGAVSPAVLARLLTP